MMQKKTYLGIELGSTRIKACLIDGSLQPISSGSFEWENSYENGYWTYALDDIQSGVRNCFSSLKEDAEKKLEAPFTYVDAIGISGMMHGYLVFDKDDNLLVPFRTWRNTTASKAAKKLSKFFNYNIPDRWSIAHLYQAIIDGEKHVSQIAHITTVAGYIHYLLTGEWEVGIGEASGIFPISNGSYDKEMLVKFDELIRERGFEWNISDILPKVKFAGEKGTMLTEKGATFLDDTGVLKAGIPICPPEGDAGTGMVATNSVLPGTGNVSAGTSVFSMLVLEKELENFYPEIDVVTTPDGSPVAMIHSNNGCSELDVWVNMFCEFSQLMGIKADKSILYEKLYKNTLNADKDCSGVISYNFLASEPVAGVRAGKPMYFRSIESKMTLANFFRSQIYSAIAVLKMGINILSEKENVLIQKINAHGGLFKVEGVAQQLLANVLGAKVAVSKTSGEGGAWGMALLSAYMVENCGENLGIWLSKNVFAEMNMVEIAPDKEETMGFEKYFNEFIDGLKIFR